MLCESMKAMATCFHSLSTVMLYSNVDTGYIGFLSPRAATDSGEEGGGDNNDLIIVVVVVVVILLVAVTVGVTLALGIIVYR